MPSKHAKLPPSSAERWINCPGSVALSAQLPPPGSSPYADEGTLAHAVAELKLRRNIGEITPKQYDKELAKLQENEYWCGEMDEATDFYADTVIEHLAAAGSDAELMIEQHFSLDKWVPESFGTSDAVVIGGSTIEVIDLKYGKGVKVNAEHNAQLRLYGLGASALFGDLYDFETVRYTIIQPRLDHVSTEEVPLSELLLWAEEDVAPRAIMALEGTDYMACGDWCRMCRARREALRRLEAGRGQIHPQVRGRPQSGREARGRWLRRGDALRAQALRHHRHGEDRRQEEAHDDPGRPADQTGRQASPGPGERQARSNQHDRGREGRLQQHRRGSGRDPAILRRI